MDGFDPFHRFVKKSAGRGAHSIPLLPERWLAVSWLNSFGDLPRRAGCGCFGWVLECWVPDEGFISSVHDTELGAIRCLAGVKHRLPAGAILDGHYFIHTLPVQFILLQR